MRGWKKLYHDIWVDYMKAIKYFNRAGWKKIQYGVEWIQLGCRSVVERGLCFHFFSKNAKIQPSFHEDESSITWWSYAYSIFIPTFLRVPGLIIWFCVNSGYYWTRNLKFIRFFYLLHRCEREQVLSKLRCFTIGFTSNWPHRIIITQL